MTRFKDRPSLSPVSLADIRLRRGITSRSLSRRQRKTRHPAEQVRFSRSFLGIGAPPPGKLAAADASLPLTPHRRWPCRCSLLRRGRFQRGISSGSPGSINVRVSPALPAGTGTFDAFYVGPIVVNAENKYILADQPRSNCFNGAETLANGQPMPSTQGFGTYGISNAADTRIQLLPQWMTGTDSQIRSDTFRRHAEDRSPERQSEHQQRSAPQSVALGGRGV